ncbi:hypothetical protein SMICM17S_05211 [Streptomyces microflavus]
MCVGRIHRNGVMSAPHRALPPLVGRAIVRFMETPDNATEHPEEAPAATGIAAQSWTTASAEPQYRAAVVDLLGALAYGELAAFERLAEDAKLAPTLGDKAELAKMASAEFHHFEQLSDRLAAVDEDPTAAMEPFAKALDDFHRQTAPSDWLEGLVKAYVGDSIASDFYREGACPAGALPLSARWRSRRLPNVCSSTADPYTLRRTAIVLLGNPGARGADAEFHGPDGFGSHSSPRSGAKRGVLSVIVLIQGDHPALFRRIGLVRGGRVDVLHRFVLLRPDVRALLGGVRLRRLRTRLVRVGVVEGVRVARVDRHGGSLPSLEA